MQEDKLERHITSDNGKWLITAILGIFLIASVAALAAWMFGAFNGSGGKLPQGNNAAVRDTPGKWFYNASDGAVFAAEPVEKNGVLTVTAEDWGTDYFYFRYQPGEAEGLAVGDEFTVTFTAELSCDGKAVYRYDDDSTAKTEGELTAGEAKTFTLEGCVLSEGSGPFYVGVPAETEAGATFSVRDVVFEKTEGGEQ